MLTVGSLFSGIGGLDLGLERAGMQTRWMCEIDPFCRDVLRHHWPDIDIAHDVRDVNGDEWPYVDLICGGFPCQPVSLAGKRLAQADPRWLWPEFARVVGELRPKYVLVENVPGLASKGLADVLADLSEIGYDAEWDVVPASAVGAPHIRERLFLVAYPSGERRQQVAGSSCGHEEAHGRGPQEDHQPASDGEGHRAGEVPGDVADHDGPGQSNAQGSAGPSGTAGRKVLGSSPHRPGTYIWAPEPDVGRVAHGVPNRVDRLRALGNAVVPQVAEFVGRQIVAHYLSTNVTHEVAT